ncbi:uncharacterized protein LOC127461479 [Manacus candei]|uniref:uncharacterized protein LOC127461479 n=1 Tax=Manacus candei TaxID=415023 RepID=UPI00222784EE|nr:uncharacterized protein LOC127461479 [Manacus candei]XP_051625285.1 uncharacterized protein LOC127461479 [Manacus candei]XP_051625286.1 uncharacterized protein LOC127461479 [Manacus candei]
MGLGDVLWEHTALLNQRVTGSAGLEGTFEIINPSLDPTPLWFPAHGTDATSSLSLNTSRDGESTPSLGSPFQWLSTLSAKKFFLISNLNLPWHSCRPSPLVLLMVAWEKRPIPPPAPPSCQGVAESEEVSPEPPLLQAEPPQLPQPLLTALVLQSLPQPRCSPLDLLQPLHVLPELRAQNWTQHSRGGLTSAESRARITSLALLATLFLSQARIHWPSCPPGHTLAPVQLPVHPHSQLPSCLAALQPLWPSLELPGVVVAKGQDPALGLVEPHPLGISPWIQPLQVNVILISFHPLKKGMFPKILGVEEGFWRGFFAHS